MKQPQDTFNYYPERFADKKILRYQVPGFEQPDLRAKTVYPITWIGFGLS